MCIMSKDKDRDELMWEDVDYPIDPKDYMTLKERITANLFPKKRRKIYRRVLERHGVLDSGTVTVKYENSGVIVTGNPSLKGEDAAQCVITVPLRGVQGAWHDFLARMDKKLFEAGMAALRSGKGQVALTDVRTQRKINVDPSGLIQADRRGFSDPRRYWVIDEENIWECLSWTMLLKGKVAG